MKKVLALAVLVLTLSSGCVWAWGMHRYMNYWADEYRKQLILASVVHVVEPGETLWDISRRYHPDCEPRAVVDYIRDINGLEGPSGPLIHPGQCLRIPMEF